MLKLNLWHAKWDLDEAQCPCDIHFNDWIAANRITGKTIYHFGTGKHHVVGITQATNGSDNVVFGITASIEEYESYIALVSAQPKVAKNYLTYFGDIYLSNARLMPAFDVVTLFHAGEFIADNTTSAAYGGADDTGVANIMLDRMPSGGYLLFFHGSFAHDKAAAIAEKLVEQKKVERLPDYKTLLVCRKL
jgi:hypothetical protein